MASAVTTRLLLLQLLLLLVTHLTMLQQLLLLVCMGQPQLLRLPQLQLLLDLQSAAAVTSQGPTAGSWPC
jgi:hypothetical protein